MTDNATNMTSASKIVAKALITQRDSETAQQHISTEVLCLTICSQHWLLRTPQRSSCQGHNGMSGGELTSDLIITSISQT